MKENAEIIDARKYAVGSIKETFEKYSHLEKILPAMGYGEEQIRDLEKTINLADCDVVLAATPIDLKRIIKVNKPIIRVRYGVGEEAEKELEKIIEEFLKNVDFSS